VKTIVRNLNYLRLAGFSLGYGLLGALVGGTLNRIMIADLRLPATLVGLFFALPLLESPLRLWLGYRSDGFPVLGRRREPYILAGALLAGLGIVAAVAAATNSAGNSRVWLLGALLAFGLYGFGRNLAHNTFQALLADTFTGDQRPRAMTAYEVATLLGLVMGAGGLGKALEVFEPGKLLAVTLGAATVAVVLTGLAVLAQERRTPAADQIARQARSMPFAQAVREVVAADPQVRLFFVLVLFTIIGTLAQDVLLEPYGALVLGMPVGDTSRLTAYWGLGVMASMLLSGLFLIKRLGYLTVLRLGLISSLLVFVGLVAVGVTGSAGLFRGLVLVMGLGTGLAGAGMLTGIINFTTTVRAGLLMGVWGMANLVGRAAGSLLGGAVVDLIQAITAGNALLAYGTVFVLEAAMLLAALALSLRFNVGASKARREEQQVGQAPLQAASV
jgi:BCD family chlorophyll transporter-like MFS transporter